MRLPMATNAVTTSTAAGASVTTGSLQAYEKKQRGFGRLNQGLIDRQQASKMRLSIRFARSYATFSRMIGSIHPKSARIDVLRRLETTRIAAFETALSHTQNSVNFPFTTHLQLSRRRQRLDARTAVFFSIADRSDLAPTLPR